MGNILSKNCRNKLKLFLNDVFKNECVFTIDAEEVEFIQNGIEFCVQKIVDILHEEKFCLDHGPQQDVKSLKEVYFPIKMDRDVDKLLYEKIPFVRSSIVKVGSFYEETKNKYPNEFDFIIYLYCLKTIPSKALTYNFLDIFRHLTQKYAQVLQHNERPKKHNKRRRNLRFVQVLEQHGPATELQFLYTNEYGNDTIIHVDLVPAIKIVPCNLRKSFKEWIVLEPFRKHVLKTGSVLYTHECDSFSFTETEVHFVKKKLSANHVKIYRILKYIVNGHGDDKSNYFLTTNGCHLDFPSYFIKVMMIYHHYECNNNYDDIDLCFLQVIEKILHLQEIPYLSTGGRCNLHIFSIFPLFKDAYNYFQMVQDSDCMYEYDTFKINQSISQHFVDLDIPDHEKVMWPGGWLGLGERFVTIFSTFHAAALFT